MCPRCHQIRSGGTFMSRFHPSGLKAQEVPGRQVVAGGTGLLGGDGGAPGDDCLEAEIAVEEDQVGGQARAEGAGFSG